MDAYGPEGTVAVTTAVRAWVRPARAMAVVVAAGLCATCNYGEVVVVQPAATGHGPLTLSIQADPEDTAVARELGWRAGIPGAEVTVSPGDADTAAGPPVATLETDSVGRASVLDVPDGNYLVEVRRLLTSAEAARLAPGQDVIGFMAKEMVARGGATIATPASRRHSVVISEWAFFGEAIPGLGGYMFGGFLELGNNADTTVYLDGLVIGEGFTQAADFVPGRCAAFESWTNDPDGIWARFFDSLPGSGHTYPLEPGAVAVIATDAIDHSAISPEGLDLSHTEFEFAGTADVDNPTVPNTVSIGFSPYWDGHGLYLNDILDEVVFVALPIDTAALPRRRMLTSGNEYGRVPRNRVLDVIALLSTFQFREPLCPQLVHRNFDRYRARLLVSHVGREPDAGPYSVQRKVAYARADGRKILQHTRTSNADFFLGLRTPGWLP